MKQVITILLSVIGIYSFGQCCPGYTVVDITEAKKFKLSFGEKRYNSGRDFVFRLKTEMKLECANHRISTTTRRDKETISMTINNLAKAYICVTSPVNYIPDVYYAGRDVELGPLPNGAYRVLIIYNGDTTVGRIEAKETSATFTLEEGFASTDGEQKFIRIPSNTLWGYVLFAKGEDSSLVAEYYKLLKKEGCGKKKIDSGVYVNFQIDKKGKFLSPVRYNWAHQAGFIFDYKGSFETLKEVTKKFISEKGDNRVNVKLLDNKGRYFNEDKFPDDLKPSISD